MREEEGEKSEVADMMLAPTLKMCCRSQEPPLTQLSGSSCHNQLVSGVGKQLWGWGWSSKLPIIMLPEERARALASAGGPGAASWVL